MKKPEHTPINAVKLVRDIRDAHAAQLEGKSVEDRLVFYRDQGREAQTELERLSRQRVSSRPTSA